MSQNNHKNFENEGWEAMFQTLEREMPVKKKRRGALWLWVCVGAVVAGSVFLYAKKTAQPVEVIVKDSKTIVYGNNFSDLNKKIDTLTAIATPATRTNSLVVEATNATNFPSSPQIQATKISLSRIELPNTAKNGPLSITPNSSLEMDLKLLNTNLATTESFNFTKNAPLSITADSSPKMDFESSKPSFSTIELLDLVQNAPLSITRDSSLKIELNLPKSRIITPKQIENKLIWGITAGVHLKQMQYLDGYHAGLVLVKPFSEKWGVSTGLNFRQTKMEQQSQRTSYFEFRADSYQLAQANVLPKVRSISVYKIYCLDMPFTIDYKITKKWAVSSGIKLSYLFGQKTITSDTSVFLVKSAFNSANFDVLQDISTTSLGLNRWDAAVLGGIQYVPTRHIQLGLRYDFGLFNNFNRVGQSAYNRYVGLNAVYLF